jgi:outer membrane protein TolC
VSIVPSATFESPGRRRQTAWRCAWLAAVASVLLPAGCSRNFWRTQTDKDVYHLLDHKKDDPRWDVPRVDIMPDPSSRLFDPYDLDNAPLPLDDPAAGRYMLRVAGMSGYKSWHKFGVRFSIENPNWLERYGLTPQIIEQTSLNNEPSTAAGSVELKNVTLQDAVELANLHSRDYQFQIEEAYLAALAVTFERFQFGVRYLGLGGLEPTVDAEHSVTPGGPNNFGLNSRFGVSQFLPSGGQWIVEMANSTLWLFSSGNQMATSSAISYSLVQPLLFQAGRKIALENLTQSERSSLYAVRDLARFRKTFFADVATGYLQVLRLAQTVEIQRDNVRRNLEQLEQLQAINSQVTVFYYEDLAKLPAGIDLPPILRGQLDYVAATKRLQWRGRMSALQRQALLNLSGDADWQKAVKSLIQLRIFEPLAALPAGIQIPPSLSGQLSYSAAKKRLYWKGPMGDVQERLLLSLSSDLNWKRAAAGLVGRMRTDVRDSNILRLQSNLLSSENSVRSAEVQYRTALDAFKIQIGLPPNINMDVDRSLLKPFQLIDPRLSAMEKRLKDFVLVWGKLDDNDPDEAQLRDVIVGLRNLRNEVQTNVFDVVRGDAARLLKILPERMKSLTANAEQSRLRSDIIRDNELQKSLQRDYEQTTRELVQLEKDFGKPGATDPIARRGALIAALGAVQGAVVYQQQKRAAVTMIATLREELLQIARNAQGIQIGIRVELIELGPFNMTIDEAIRVTLATRLDLKNSRAQVMDARRKLEIAANRLQAVLNLKVDGDVRTPTGNKPLDFRGNTSNFRVGVGFTAPLDLITQRNNYRAAQIAYQRARRAYMSLEDSIKLAVRTEWRSLDLQRRNFETSRNNVRVTATQYDSTVEEANAPAQGAAQQGASSATGVNLLNALSSVVRSQTDLIQGWVNYETSRLNIYADMGMMDVDARGLWSDPFYQRGVGTASPGVPPAPSSAIPAARAPGPRNDLRRNTASNGNVTGGIAGNGNPEHGGGFERDGRIVPAAQAGKVRLVARPAEARTAAAAGGNGRRRGVLLPDHP